MTLRGPAARRWTPFAVLVLWLSSGGTLPASAKSFADDLATPIGQLFARSLAGSIGRALPVPAASAGVVYQFDPESGAFERETAILGQLFLERADPVGKGRLNVHLSYQHVQIDEFEGEDLTSLSDTDVPIRDPDNGALFTIPLFGIDLDTHQMTASVTYGVTDDVEVNLTVPVIYSEFELNAVFQALRVRAPQTFHTRASKLGVGDLFVRGKYRALARDRIDGALGLVIRIPAGNEDNFQGTGALELAPMLYLSSDGIPLGRFRLRPYLNGGINFDADDVDSSEGRWGVGLDGEMAGWFTAAVAVLGRHPFRRVGRPGLLDVPRAGPVSPAPLFGIVPRRPDFYDLSAGGRVNLWRDTVIGFFNALVPLNDDGFRAEVIPLVGVEATF